MQSASTQVAASSVFNDPKLQAYWVARARLGGYVGEQARSTLVKAYYPWIVQRCLHTLGNEADALDAAQEASLSMHQSLPRFEARATLRTWLNSIIKNECINLIRRQQRHTLTNQLTALIAIFEEQCASTTACPIAQAEVHRAMEMLPSEQREVLYLRFFSDLPLAEISNLLGISLSAAKMRLYRALDSFADVFAQGSTEKAQALTVR